MSEADPVPAEPIDPKAERAAAIQAAVDAKAGVLQAASDAFDAKVAVALADESYPIPTLEDLDYIGSKRRLLAGMRARAERLASNLVNAQGDFERDLAAKKDPVVATWEEFVGGV